MQVMQCLMQANISLNISNKSHAILHAKTSEITMKFYFLLKIIEVARSERDMIFFGEPDYTKTNYFVFESFEKCERFCRHLQVPEKQSCETTCNETAAILPSPTIWDHILQ